MTTRTDYRDALAWLYAALRRDQEGRSAIANHCSPTGLVDALTDLHLGLAAVATHQEPEAYLNYLRDNLDRILDRQDWPND